MKLIHDEFADVKNTHPNVSEEEKNIWIFWARQALLVCVKTKIKVPGFIKLHNSFLELYSSKRFAVYNVLKILRFCNQFFGLFLSPNKTYISVFAKILARFPYKCMNNIDQMYDFVFTTYQKRNYS